MALTGVVTHLPLFPDGQWEEENPSGITYNDGTILLYRNYKNIRDQTDEFRAALLRPGDDEWTLVQGTLEFPPYTGEFWAAYHAGKILVAVEGNVCQIVTPTMTPSDDVDLIRTLPWMPLKHNANYCYQQGHIFESSGKLLWATVQVRWDSWKEYREGASDLARFLLVSVHALEDGHWAPKKGASLDNLVLFLGWPNSFSVDASRLGINGGFAYFTHFYVTTTGVYRYNLVDNTAEFIDWLPQGWSHQMCTWIIPQPTIAPIHRGRPTTPRSNKIIKDITALH